MAESTGKICPGCKTENTTEEKNCVNCGQQLAEPDFLPSPVKPGKSSKKAVFSPGIIGAVLAIEIDDTTLRAVVVRRKLRAIEVSNFVKIERTSEDVLISAEELAALTARIDKCPQNVVLVSSLASMVEIALDNNVLKKLRPHQLKEAARWEAEPYMAVPATESLVGYEKGLENDEGQTGIWVAMLPEEDFKNMKKTFAERGYRLKRAHAPDVCFPVGAAFGTGEKELVVVDVGLQNIKVALVEEGNISSLKTLPFNLEAISLHLDGLSIPELEPALKDAFKDLFIFGKKVVVTGSGGLNPEVTEFLQRVIGVETVPLQFQAADIHITADFAAVVGAALREIYFPSRWRTIGLDNSVSLFQQLKERVHIFPLMVVVTIALFFLGHYLLLHVNMSRAEAELAVITGERETLQARADRYAALQTESADLTAKITLNAGHIEFFQRGAKNQTRTLEKFLAALQNHAPEELVYTAIKPFGGGLWQVTGESGQHMEPKDLALAMQGEEWCSYAKVISIVRQEENYGFELLIMLAN